MEEGEVRVFAPALQRTVRAVAAEGKNALLCRSVCVCVCVSVCVCLCYIVYFIAYVSVSSL